jgi:hypothetical protein
MSNPGPGNRTTPETAHLTREERKSLTHGEFWIPEAEREIYRTALETLNRHGIPYVVSGLYALYEYTGIYRQTKDLDLFVEPQLRPEPPVRCRQKASRRTSSSRTGSRRRCTATSRSTSFSARATASRSSMRGWFEHSRAGILAGTQVRVAPPEELLWHRLFVSERHRSDVSDVLHLILPAAMSSTGSGCSAGSMCTGACCSHRCTCTTTSIPDTGRASRSGSGAAVRRTRRRRSRTGDPSICQGTLISRFSYNIDVNEWGFRDLRKEATIATRQLPIVQRDHEQRRMAGETEEARSD